MNKNKYLPAVFAFLVFLIHIGTIKAQAPFITVWKTDNAGTSRPDQITIPTTSGGFNYNVQWAAAADPTTVLGSLTGQTGDVTITFPAPGIYEVSITGDFPQIFFNDGGDKEKILEVKQWGDIAWSSMWNAFNGAVNLQVTATDAPDLNAVTSMKSMFRGATSLNSDLSHWDVSNVTDMGGLFFGARAFNGNISNWDVSRVFNMGQMFQSAVAFDGDLSGWDVSGVTNMSIMFAGASAFTGTGLGGWDVGHVISMSSMFAGATVFNTDISSWDVSSVIDMASMFIEAAAFNGNISGWDVSNVTSMSYMFMDAAAFNQPLTHWDVSNVTTMERMFWGAGAFNGDLSGWDVGNVTNMLGMFNNASAFNTDISGWDVSQVTSMNFMFQYATVFNNDLSSWDVSSVTDMQLMFYAANAFDQDLGGWDISAVTNMEHMLSRSGLSSANYDATLIGWSRQTVQPGIILGSQDMEYCAAAERQSLIDNHGWTFIGDAPSALCTVPGAFVTTWNTNITGGASGPTQISIPTTGSGYNYDIQWVSVADATMTGSLTGQTGDVTITFPAAGIYMVSITGDFPRIYFNDAGDKEKILTVEQWGNIAWTSMESAFYGAINLQVNATDAPDLSRVTSTAMMFGMATSLNNDLSHWDVSNVTNMELMFGNAWAFDGDLSGWDVSNVTNMGQLFLGARLFTGKGLSGWDVSGASITWGMFTGTHVFNADISGWDVSNVINMNSMFQDALAFDADLSSWDVSSVQQMGSMFTGAAAFNSDISSWDVGNVTITEGMFEQAAAFNADISGWNMSNVVYMRRMFLDAVAFDRNLGGWDITAAVAMESMFNNSGLSDANYDATLTGWAAQAVQPGVPLGAVGRSYCSSAGDRYALINDHGWTITGDTYSATCTPEGAFVTTWNPGTVRPFVFTIPTTGTGYDYDVHWVSLDDPTAHGVVVNQTGDVTLTVPAAGTYRVSIVGDFPRIYVNHTGDRNMIRTVEQWGNIAWTSMENAFYGAENLQITATDAPDLSGVTSMAGMFADAFLLNSDLSHWDVSSVTDMASMFYGATAFNGNVGSWDVSSVTDMAHMFTDATVFDQDLSGWDIAMVADMAGMLDNTVLSRAHYDAMLTGWAAQAVQPGVSLGATGLEYCADVERQSLIDDHGWAIAGDVLSSSCLLPITGITFVDGSFVYDGTAQSLAITGTLPAGTSVSYVNNDRTDAGSQTVTANISGGGVYQDLVLTATLTVTPATITGITFANGTFVYDGTAQSLAIGGTLPAGTSVSYADNSRTDAGSQTATATVSGGTNYDNLVLTATLTVTPATITGITFADGTFVYDGTAQSLAIGGTLPAGTSVSYADNSRTDAGSQTATATIRGGINYADLVLTATLTVTPATITGITFADGTFVYDGTA
ncbi:BspA family leucine-rich repeat surface protein, partial [Parapedobacter sp.]